MCFPSEASEGFDRQLNIEELCVKHCLSWASCFEWLSVSICVYLLVCVLSDIIPKFIKKRGLFA